MRFAFFLGAFFLGTAVYGQSIDAPSVETRRIQQRQAALRQALDPRLDGWHTESTSEYCSNVLKTIAATLEAPGDVQSSVSNVAFAKDFRCGEIFLKGVPNAGPPEILLCDMGELPAQPQIAGGFDSLIQQLKQQRQRFGASAVVRTKIKLFKISSFEATLRTEARFEAVVETNRGIVELHAIWSGEWKKDQDDRIELCQLISQNASEARSPNGRWFADVTSACIGPDPVVRKQLGNGMEYWLRLVEERHGIHDSGREGIAIADFNNDGFEDLYVCQTGGLPNRLLVQDEFGVAHDVAVDSGVDFLDQTSAALAIDLDNDGDQDLVLAMRGSLLLLENDGQLRFKERTKLQLPDEDSKSLTAADYDLDGDLDLYVCVDLASFRTNDSPSFEYHDANEGGRNVLYANQHSEGQPWQMIDATRESGLDANNRRHSLAAAWEDYDLDGDPDLYVANDYGQNSLYENVEGRFVDVAARVGVIDSGSGMSVSWGDYNRDGRPDLYVGNMWSSAGSRVVNQSRFRANAPPAIRQILRRFAKGNSLFLNRPDGSFTETGGALGVEMGRWAWSSLFVDLNNDSWEDLVVANGYLTTPDSGDL